MAAEAEIPDLLKEEPCIMCKEPGSKQCGACHLAKYCSKQCQRADYKMHKHFCAAANDPSPSPSHQRAILFPGANGPHDLAPNPRFVWIEVAQRGSLQSFDWEICYNQMPAHYSSVQNEVQGKCYDPIDQSGKGECLKFWIDVHAYRLFANASVMKSTKDGTAESVWRGPVLVTKMSTPYEHWSTFEDVGMRHVRHAADFFTSRGAAYPVAVAVDGQGRPLDRKGNVLGPRFIQYDVHGNVLGDSHGFGSAA